jgi:hypothetical protein
MAEVASEAAANFSRQVCFELGWRPTGECQVQAATIVGVFDEGADRVADLIEIAIIAPVDLLLLGCLKLSALALS